MFDVSIIIPVLNGSAFLGDTLRTVRTWLVSLHRPCEIVVVDDGSTDATPAILREVTGGEAGAVPIDWLRREVPIRWLRNERNQGKGYSVRRGMLAAEGRNRVFMDADLTYPIECTRRVLEALERGADVAIADRMHPDSRYIVAPGFFRYLYTRHLMGRFFNLLVRTFVVPGIRDTQAGLKGFRREAVLDLFPRGNLPRFSFDVELLYVAQRRGKRIEPVPITFAYRKEPSTVRFLRDTVQMLIDMARVRLRGIRGAYDRPLTPDPAPLPPPAAPATTPAPAPGRSA